MDDVRELLKTWELPQLIPLFEEQQITIQALAALSKEDVKELIPQTGPRVLFIRCWSTWKTEFSQTGCSVIIDISSLSGEYRQERAIVKVCNPKYTSNCTALTKRGRRGEPYRTNCTVIVLQPLYNNFTARILIGTKGYPKLFDIKVKMCDIVHTKWLKDYFETFSNMPLTCPVPPGTYGLFNMEFPPKNFPLPIPEGETFYITFLTEVTDTKEVVVEMSLVLRKD